MRRRLEYEHFESLFRPGRMTRSGGGLGLRSAIHHNGNIGREPVEMFIWVYRCQKVKLIFYFDSFI